MKQQDREGGPPHRHRSFIRHPLLALVAGLALGIYLGYALASPSVPPAPEIRPSPSGLRSPTETTIPGEGMYWVGTDVRPGLYRSVGNDESACTWRREEDPSGGQGEVLADGTTSGWAYVRLSAGEFFVTQDCSQWKRIASPSDATA